VEARFFIPGSGLAAVVRIVVLCTVEVANEMVVASKGGGEALIAVS
jgi:hypothetical protein